MGDAGIGLIDACERAMEIIVRTSEMEKLYQRAVRCVGEGQLRISVMNMATDAIQDKCLCEEVFVSDERIVTFFCGIWLQFLLVDIAGVKKEKLRAMVQEVLKCDNANSSIH